MIDLQLIRKNPESVQKGLDRRHDDTSLSEIIKLDEQNRKLIQQIEELREKRNKVSKEIGRMKQKPPEMIAEMRQVGVEMK